ncbi:MAG: pyroglutamyl-peptidase I [Alphaproteobacteria bacterium]|nr:pyroglutamyl-peptidase I [Alphaproteobacteria bacterium]
MKPILLTGFEPYGDTPINPAEQVATKLDGAEIDGAVVVSRIVPNTFFKCIDFMKSTIEAVQPEIIVMLGEYPGRAVITVERIAQNLNDDVRYQLKDNDGNSVQDELTAPDGPVAYYATLPIRAMVRAMRDAGIPADISDVTATFCCNHLMYGTLHHIAVNRLDIRAGWIHLPYLPEVAACVENLGAPSMSVETAAAGVRAAIAAILAHPVDTDDPIVSRLQI